MSATRLWLEAVQWFDPYMDLETVGAQALWFFGGVFFAFAMGAFSTIGRATRDAPTL